MEKDQKFLLLRSDRYKHPKASSQTFGTNQSVTVRRHCSCVALVKRIPILRVLQDCHSLGSVPLSQLTLSPHFQALSVSVTIAFLSSDFVESANWRRKNLPLLTLALHDDDVTQTVEMLPVSLFLCRTT